MSENSNKIEPKQLSKAVADLAVARNAHRTAANEEDTRLHEELWALIHKENPELDVDSNYSVNAEFAEQGVVMLTSAEDCNCGADHSELPEFIESLISGVKDAPSETVVEDGTDDK